MYYTKNLVFGVSQIAKLAQVDGRRWIVAAGQVVAGGQMVAGGQVVDAWSLVDTLKRFKMS